MHVHTPQLLCDTKLLLQHAVLACSVAAPSLAEQARWSMRMLASLVQQRMLHMPALHDISSVSWVEIHPSNGEICVRSEHAHGHVMKLTMACSAEAPFTLENVEGAPASGDVHSNCRASSLFPSIAAACRPTRLSDICLLCEQLISRYAILCQRSWSTKQSSAVSYIQQAHC